MEKLIEYLKTTTQAELARKVGVTPAAISMLANGRRVPSFRTMRLIHEATGGQVTYADWGAGVGAAE